MRWIERSACDVDLSGAAAFLSHRAMGRAIHHASQQQF